MDKQLIKPCEFVSGACIHCQATKQSDCEGWVCPPQRQWLGLTEEEIMVIGDKVANEDLVGLVSNFRVRLARAIEAKLKERNG